MCLLVHKTLTITLRDFRYPDMHALVYSFDSSYNIASVSDFGQLQ